MAAFGRVTVTLPSDLLRDIDRREKNRSKFVADAVRRELSRRRRAELRRSLESPHPEAASIDDGLREWANSLPPDDPGALVNLEAGKPVRWAPGRGWLEGRR